MRRSILFIWLASIVAISLLYIFAGRELILASLEGKAPSWFDWIVTTFYPRFVVEKHRFDNYFFLSKADQVIVRFCLVQIALMAFTAVYYYKSAFRSGVHTFWNITVSVRHVYWLKVLFYLGMFFFTYDWFYYLELVRPAVVFYKPLLILRMLNIGFPSVVVNGILYAMLMISYVAVIFNFKPVISSIIGTLLFLLLQGWLYSFEKIDHTFSTLTYAALLMPLLLYEHKKAIIVGSHVQAAWPLQLIRVCIALVYFMAGLEKLLIAGTNWFNPESFRSYLYMHQAVAGLWVAQSNILCTVLPFAAMIFQLGFIVILFFPRLICFVLLSGIAFHTGTYLLLGVGWYFNAWIFMYIFFINWNSLSQYVRKFPAIG